MEVYSAVSIFIFHTSCFDFTSEVKWKNNTIQFHSATKMSTNQYRNTVYACISLQFYLNYIWQKKKKKDIFYYSLFLQPNGAISTSCIFPEVLQRYWHIAELQLCLQTSPLWVHFYYYYYYFIYFREWRGPLSSGQDLLSSFIIQSLTRAKGRDECVNKASREW